MPIGRPRSKNPLTEAERRAKTRTKLRRREILLSPEVDDLAKCLTDASGEGFKELIERLIRAAAA